MFLTIRQNNSGGYYVLDDKLGVGETIIIECDTIKEAKLKFRVLAEEYGDSFYNYCNCCGERWPDFEYNDEEDLTESPSVYGITLEDYDDRWIYRGYIHYKSGEFKYFETKKKND